MIQPTCFAATTEVGNRGIPAARCGVTGMIRDAEGSPCCGAYDQCPIWRKEKERVWLNKRFIKATEHVRTDGSLAWA